MSLQETFCAKELQQAEVVARYAELSTALNQSGTCILSEVVEVNGQPATMHQDWIFPRQEKATLTEVPYDADGTDEPRHLLMEASYDAAQVTSIVRLAAAGLGDRSYIRLTPARMPGTNDRSMLSSYPESLAEKAREVFLGSAATRGATV